MRDAPDAVSVGGEYREPQLRVQLHEGRRQLTVEPVVEQHELRLGGPLGPRTHEHVARVRVAVHEAAVEDLRVERTAEEVGDVGDLQAHSPDPVDVGDTHALSLAIRAPPVRVPFERAWCSERARREGHVTVWSGGVAARRHSSS